MARRSSRKSSASSRSGGNRPTHPSWLSPDTRNELRGIGFGVLGIITLLSLINIPGRGNLVGTVGEHYAGGLVWLAGRPMAFSVPLLLLWWGWLAFRGQHPRHSWIKYAGALLMAISVSALTGLATRHLDDTACWEWTGFFGYFLMFDSIKTFNLPRYLGVSGSAVLFVALAMTGLLLATDVLFTKVAARIGRFLMWAIAWTGQHLRGTWKSLIEMVWVAREESDEQEEIEVEEPTEPRRRRSRRAAAPRPVTRVLNPVDDVDIPELAPAPPVSDPVIVRHDENTPPPPPKRERRTRDPEEVPALVQTEFDLGRPYELPPLSLLNPIKRAEHRMSDEEIRDISAVLEKTLRDFGIEATVTQVTQGPVITCFELRPAAGVKINKIVSLQSDIAMALRARSVRILAPIPGKAAVGIEVPNRKPNFVHFHELARSQEFQNHPSPLAFILGKTIAGEPCVLDLAKMPHLLIAGATGSGKSVGLNALIASILFRQPPDKVKFMLIDPKKVEFALYDAIPHLISPVVTDSRKAPSALAWMVEHMEERYRQLAEVGVRNIDAYNRIVTDDKPNKKAMNRDIKFMPHIIVVIDELADLMMVAKADVEESVQRIAQMARAVGIHLVLATQRPSVNVITGVIKSNLPSRVAFQVSQKVDSRVIIDQMGADTLLGNGDLLFSSGGAAGPQRIQGAFIADEEVESLTDFILAQEKAVYLKSDFQPKRSKGKGDGDEPITQAGDERGDLDLSPSDFTFRNETFSDDPLDEDLFRQAAKLILTNRKASVSLLQRRMKIGFARAGRLMDQMEEAGLVGPYRGSKPREILVDPAEHLAKIEAKTEAA